VPEADVRIEGVTKRFGDVVAVDDLSLEVGRGEFFSLLGPSGCGKTTTLRMIGGFEDVTTGTIYLGDTDVTGLPPFKRATNTVFQNYALFPHLNIFENIAFGLRRRKMSDADIRERVGTMLSLVELEGFEKRRPSQLSGGQQQRIALARALVNNPQVLLLDEPLGALDLKLRRQMQVELKRIQSEVGITFIFVTHDQEEAMTMSDRIAVIHRGRIEQLGTPEDLYERPATEFVARFLGVSNLLEATVAGTDDRFASMKLKDGTVVRAPAAMVNGRTDVRVGVRPEKLRILADDGVPVGNDLNVIEGTVLDSSYMGVSTQYLIATPYDHRVVVYAQNLETSGASEVIADGHRVRLTWKPQHTFVIEGAGETTEELDPKLEEELTDA
jgi:spermidine/putrescine transport system ATP-binding protein